LLDRLEASIDLLERPTRDVGERHQTMRAAIEWSWQLLEADEQQALCEAAVFAGGFTLEAAEAVLLAVDEPSGDQRTGDEPANRGLTATKRWAGDIVEALVDKSLVRRVLRPDEPLRFDLFSTIREFALGQMDDSHRRGTERAHARYYSDLLSEVRSADFSREAENIVAAFHRMEGRDPDLAAEAALGCYRVLRSRRAYRKILAIADSALACDITDPHLESKLFGARAISHEKLGRYSAALDDVRAGLGVVKGVDAPKSAVFLQVTESTILRATGRASNAYEPLEDALEAVATLEDPWLEAIVRGNLAVVAFECGEFEGALRHLHETIDFARRHEIADVEAYACCNAAHYEWEMGRLSRAADLLERAHQVHPGGDRKFELNYLNGLGHLSLASGEHDEARAYFRRALDSDQSIGDRHSRVPSLLGLSFVPAAPKSRPPDSYLREVLDIVAPSDDSLTRVQALVQLAAIDLAAQDFREASRRLELAVNDSEALEDRRIGALSQAWLSIAQAGLGQMESAHATIERAVEALDASSDTRPPAKSLLEDLEYFRRATALFDTAEAPGPSQIRTLADEVHERLDAQRCEPAARIWLWRNYQHLADLIEIIEKRAEHLQTAMPARSLRVKADGSRFAPPGVDRPVDLSSRAALKRIISKLGHMRVESPGSGLSVSQAVGVGWPDDVVTKDAGRSRVYTAIRTLRDQGLSDILITGPGGYMLDPDVPFSWLDA
jgi:tetratricopeptide (TPR) repeat protein